jgi:F-type H+-transporting ATPase subunit gamma
MANLKSLKLRIKSVKSTRKITKAMQMVAASKLKRAQERAQASRPYAEKMQAVLAALASKANPDTAPELMVGRRENGVLKEKKILVVVISSDRGLCGALNSGLTRAIKLRLNAWRNSGVEVSVASIGKKAWEILRATHGDNLKKYFDTTSRKVPDYIDAKEAGNFAIEGFTEGKFDTVYLAFNRFVSPLVQQATIERIIPMDVEKLKSGNDEYDAFSVYEYEPDEESILADILPRNVGLQIYKGMLENSASEQAARMTAMDNATRNAGEMINKLTLVYNRSRQAAITTELTEIISGAEAL